MPLQTTRLGLTGGIGSGKSTVADIFAALGAKVIDADAISRSLTAPHGAAMSMIKQQFGDTMVNADGSLNRERMRGLVFADINAKKNLETIIHPLVQREIQRQDKIAVSQGVKLVVYDIPLLVESQNWRPILDLVFVIDCLVSTQLERVMRRNSFKQEDIEKIISTQANRKMRNKSADILVFNDSISIEQLRQQVALVAKRLQ